jgi:hypothetical protein
VKRAFEVSAETIIRSSPAVLDVLAQQLVASYRRGCEVYVKTAIEGATYPTAIAVAAGGTDLVKQLHVAASAVYMDTGGMPDVWLVSNTVWAQIGGYSATDGRQLFPYLSPMNTAGTSGGVTDFTLNPLGLRVAVSHLATSTSSFLFNSDAIPTWESARVDYSIYAPTVLSYQAGYIGHVTHKALLTGATTNAGRKLTHA